MSGPWTVQRVCRTCISVKVWFTGVLKVGPPLRSRCGVLSSVSVASYEPNLFSSPRNLSVSSPYFLISYQLRPYVSMKNLPVFGNFF